MAWNMNVHKYDTKGLLRTNLFSKNHIFWDIAQCSLLKDISEEHDATIFRVEE
jgi:hypothetical protein